MKRHFVILVLVFLAVIVKQVKAQKEFHLSQYMLHQPFLNPASIGSYNNFNGALIYKKQWVNLDGSPEIQAFNINAPVKKFSNSHVGLSVVHDKIGVNNNFDISATYAYVVKLNRKTRLSLGLSAIANTQQSNYSQVQNLGDANDPLFLEDSKTNIAPNFNYGMYYYSNKFYIGLVLPKLLKNATEINNQTEKSKTSFDVAQWHYYLSGGYKFKINRKFTLTTSTLLKQVTGSPLQIDVNALTEYDKKIGVGLSYRTSEELVGLLTYQITPMFKLAYSYDYSFSELSTYQSGTHEISLIFNLLKSKQPLHISAPRF